MHKKYKIYEKIQNIKLNTKYTNKFVIYKKIQKIQNAHKYNIYIP